MAPREPAPKRVEKRRAKPPEVIEPPIDVKRRSLVARGLIPLPNAFGGKSEQAMMNVPEVGLRPPLGMLAAERRCERPRRPDAVACDAQRPHWAFGSPCRAKSHVDFVHPTDHDELALHRLGAERIVDRELILRESFERRRQFQFDGDAVRSEPQRERDEVAGRLHKIGPPADEFGTESRHTTFCEIMLESLRRETRSTVDRGLRSRAAGRGSVRIRARPAAASTSSVLRETLTACTTADYPAEGINVA